MPPSFLDQRGQQWWLALVTGVPRNHLQQTIHAKCVFCSWCFQSSHGLWKEDCFVKCEEWQAESCQKRTLITFLWYSCSLSLSYCHLHAKLELWIPQATEIGILKFRVQHELQATTFHIESTRTFVQKDLSSLNLIFLDDQGSLWT